jgi:hypothetical protein
LRNKTHNGRDKVDVVQSAQGNDYLRKAADANEMTEAKTLREI